jgi:DNA-binding MarR family transcriptional regulator
MSADHDTPRLAEDVGFLLSRASGMAVRSTNAALQPWDLRVRQYSVLSLLAERAEGISQRELAEFLGLDPSQVVALVDDLQRAGHVVRLADPQDRRMRLVTLTASGRVHFAGAVPAADRAMAAALGALSPSETRTLEELLARVVQRNLHGG